MKPNFHASMLIAVMNDQKYTLIDLTAGPPASRMCSRSKIDSGSSVPAHLGLHGHAGNIWDKL